MIHRRDLAGTRKGGREGDGGLVAGWVDLVRSFRSRDALGCTVLFTRVRLGEYPPLNFVVLCVVC